MHFSCHTGKQVSHTLSQNVSDSKIQHSTLQHDNFSLSPPLLDTNKKTVDSQSPALPVNKESEDTAPDDPPSLNKIPIYSLPDKLKKKVVISRML